MKPPERSIKAIGITLITTGLLGILLGTAALYRYDLRELYYANRLKGGTPSAAGFHAPPPPKTLILTIFYKSCVMYLPLSHDS